MTKRAPDPFNFRLFKRHNPDKSFIYYARFIDVGTGAILAQRSLGTADPMQAAAAAGRLLAELPLHQLARAKRGAESADLESSERLRDMMLSKYFVWFWGSNSDYLADKAASAKPLSTEYVKTQRRYIERHAEGYAGFKKIALRDASLFLVERWVRSLRNAGISGNVVVDALNAVRTPLSWARKRNLLDMPFTFEAIERPKEHYRKRGILTKEELARIVGLQCLDHMAPRPRLKGKKTNTGPAAIDIRMKTAILLSEITALRLGEIRGLLWRNVDWNNRLLRIEENYVRTDGRKLPKADSIGTIPYPKEIGDVLTSLKESAIRLGWFSPDLPVIYNTQPGKPVSETTIVRGYHRALELIGIENDTQAKKEGRPPHPGSIQDRHLVLHSGRHGAATRMADRLGAQQAARITRHRSLQVFQKYAGHDSSESLERLRGAMGIDEN